MREIKFRGLAEDGKWYYGYYCVNQWGEHTIFDNTFAKKVRPETICQFTGLHDKNGKEIYEVDIVIDRNKKDKAWIIEYRTDPEYVGFIPKEIGTNDISLFISWRNMEIVGNMWESPELLK